MKRKNLRTIGIVFIAGLYILGLAGCGSTKKDDSAQSAQTESATETPEAADTQEPTDTQEVTGEATEEATPEVTEEAADFTPGTLTAESYESTWLNLRFTPPADVTLATKEQMDSALGVGAETLQENLDEDQVDTAVENTTYEMMAVQASGFPNVSVCIESAPVLILDAESYVEALMSTLDSTQLGYTYGESGESEVAGQAYAALNASLTTDGVEVKQTYYIRQIGDKFASIILSYTDDTKEQADAIMAGFTAVE